MPKIIIEVKTCWASDVKQLPDGRWNGVGPIMPELPEGDTTGMNFDGWVDLTAVEKGKLPIAEIYARVSNETEINSQWQTI